MLPAIKDYISTFPEPTQILLHEVYLAITSVAPDAEESISYAMPTFKLHGKPLVYFAAFKNHIGFYATPTGHKEFEKELAQYKQGKGSVRFPIDKPMPLALIKRIVKFRVKENAQKK